MSTSPNLPRSAHYKYKHEHEHEHEHGHNHKHKHKHVNPFLFVKLVHYLVFLVEFVCCFLFIFNLIHIFLSTIHVDLCLGGASARTTSGAADDDGCPEFGRAARWGDDVVYLDSTILYLELYYKYASISAPTTAPTATSASPVVVAPPPQSELASSSDTAVLPETSKTGVLGSETTSTSTKVPGSAEATPSGVAAVPVSGNDGNSSHTSRSAAVAGGIIGGLALAALLVALIWFWRRKMQRRRSTLLTPLSPLSVTQSIGREENGAYIIQRDSIGPTSFSTKVKASVMAQYNRVRGIRNPSASPYRDGSDMTIKDRIGKVWASFGGPRNRGPRWSEKKNDAFSARGIGGSLKEKDVPRSVPLAYKPGLLTGGGDLDSEAQRRRLSRTRGASVGTTLGGLDFNFGGDPFSDVHATPHPSAKPPPLFATGANNPFSDSNAIGAEAYMPKPSSYVAEIRHSRGQSVDSTLTPNRNTHLRVVGGMSRPSSGSTAAYADSSIYLRDSTSSFDTRRNKFRSDPFDLEPLSRTVAGSDGVPTALTSDLHRMPSTNSERYRQGVGTADGGLPAAHASYNSLHSSRYTSGVSEGSMNEWAAPGSDLGPRAL